MTYRFIFGCIFILCYGESHAQDIICKSKNSFDIKISLNDHRQAKYMLNCISGEFMTRELEGNIFCASLNKYSLQKCGEIGEDGYNAGIVVSSWDDIKDWKNCVTHVWSETSSQNDKLVFDYYGKLNIKKISSTMQFVINRLDGTATLNISDHLNEYVCIKQERKF